MILRMSLLLTLSALTYAAEDPVESPLAEEPAAPPTVEDIIPASVSALPEPSLSSFAGGLTMAVTASDNETQAQVIAGLNHLHGGWEFEATRHFAAAAKRDPNCLMAHWGMIMALLAPNPETDRMREAAFTRMLDLVDEGAGNEIERGYAFALIQYRREGPQSAADTFRKLSAKFPNDIQAAIFHAIFARAGYDDSGNARPQQLESEELLEKALQKYPESTLLLNALLMIRAEAPDLSPSLPLAHKLCQLAPGYPPYFYVLGHYEWRAGNHLEAASAFNRASTLFDGWMTSSNATMMDCPGWVASECYRTVALASKGDFDTALEAANSVARIKVPLERAASPAGRMLLWEGKTLPTRLLMTRKDKGAAAKAFAALPTSKELLEYKKGSLALWLADGLRMNLDARRLLAENKYDDARAVSEAINQHGEAFTRLKDMASSQGEATYWHRAFLTLEILASDLRGELALAGPKSGQPAAFNWFRAAADRQTRSTMMLPPALLSPVSLRLAAYQLSKGEAEEAVEVYKEALKAFPNNAAALEGLAAAEKKAAESPQQKSDSE
jgi:tetratricopeptide (TPR) repeat protein